MSASFIYVYDRTSTGTVRLLNTYQVRPNESNVTMHGLSAMHIGMGKMLLGDMGFTMHRTVDDWFPVGESAGDQSGRREGGALSASDVSAVARRSLYGAHKLSDDRGRNWSAMLGCWIPLPVVLCP